MSYRFNHPYFEPHPNKDEVAFTYLSYDIGKYFFEIVRNVMVIGALKFFADKSGHWALSVLFYTSLAAFMFLFQSFFFGWRLTFFKHHFGEKAKPVDATLSFIFAAGCCLSCWFLVIVIASQIGLHPVSLTPA
jgi:Kef-type K+ transport system membrane component KefB